MHQIRVKLRRPSRERTADLNLRTPSGHTLPY